MSRWYRGLLRLYPASFRAEYGEEMTAVYAARLRDTPSAAGRLALAGEAVGDTFRAAAALHAEILRQDLRYAARAFRRAPGFAATAVLVVALGTGATTAAFSIADHALLRPLPFPDSDRLVKLWMRVHDYTRTELSPATYRDWTAAASAFEGLAAYQPTEVNLVGSGAPERLQALAVTGDLLPLLGIPPALGRLFTPDDDRPGAAGTVVLSHGLWQRRFGADPGVLGQRVLLDGEQHEVIAVMPPTFHYPRRGVALWTPLRFDEAAFEDRNDNYLHVVGRLRAGTTLTAAHAELATIMARMAAEFPADYEGYGVTAHLLRDELPQRSRLLLLALCGATLCTLLIACANLAGLLLARAAGRRRELALRTALGAGRERLARQLVTESLVLAGAGGALGLAVAWGLLPTLARLVPDAFPGAAPRLDLRVLAFAGLLTALTGLGVGVWPALRTGGRQGFDDLRADARAGGGGQPVRAALVVAQVAASVVLLASAGLLLRALWRVQSVEPGFRPDSVLTLRTALPTPRYERTADRLAFYDRVLGEVRTLPGVRHAAYASFLPMAMGGGIWPVESTGADVSRPHERMASLRFVTPGYFATLSIPLRQGRDVASTDVADRPAVAVVSESFTRRYWPRLDPIGRRFTFAFQERTVVGVVGDVRVRGLEQPSEPQVYLPAGQVPDGAIIGYTPKDLAIRYSGDPGALLPELRRIVERADPEQPISHVRLLSDIVADQTASRAVQARLLAALAGVAVLLAGLGIHGLLAYAVSSRTREIGVRLALGASRSGVVRLVLGRGLALALAGVVPGVAVAWAGGRAMQALLASVEPGDAATFAGTVAVCLVTAAVGSLAPAVRAVRVDPVLALRAE